MPTDCNCCVNEALDLGLLSTIAQWSYTSKVLCNHFINYDFSILCCMKNQVEEWHSVFIIFPSWKGFHGLGNPLAYLACMPENSLRTLSDLDNFAWIWAELDITDYSGPVTETLCLSQIWMADRCLVESVPDTSAQLLLQLYMIPYQHSG